jgi:hypothetical protein
MSTRLREACPFPAKRMQSFHVNSRRFVADLLHILFVHFELTVP